MGILKLAVFVLLLLGGVDGICAQEFTPVVRTFDRGDYNADNQNWSVSSAGDGTLWFGNGQGVLSYDGYRWKLYSLPGGKMVRTVFADGDMVYVGAHEQFGYFSRTQQGGYEYTSLSSLIDDYQMQNDEIWRILKLGDRIIFQSFTSFFVYDGVQVMPHRVSGVCLFFNECDGRIIASNEKLGLVWVDIDDGSLEPLQDVPFDSQLIAVLEFESDKWLIVTYSDGLWLYDGVSFRLFRTEIDGSLAAWQPNNALMTLSGDVVIGTKLRGAVCIDRNGNRKWAVSYSNALNSNTVLGMDYDCGGNLWLAMDGGLAMVRINQRLSYVRSIQPSVGSIYTMLYREPYLYLGTNQGLYKGEFIDDFKRISNVKKVPEVLGNVWSIADYDGQVICGTNYETFDLTGDRNSVLSSVTGGFCMAEGVINGRDVMVQGTYTNPCIYVRRSSNWAYSHSLTDFIQPIGSIAIDHTGTVWAGHRYKGLYSLCLDKDLSGIDSLAFYPSLDGMTEKPISVYSVGGRVIFLDGVSGFYTYDGINDRIVPFKELNEAMSDYPGTFSICHFQDDLYWLISSKQAVLVSFSGKEVKVMDLISYDMFGSNILDERQSITPVSDDRCIIALGNSLALYDYSVQRVENSLPELRVSSIVMSELEARRFRNVRIDYSFPHYTENTYAFSFSLDSQPWSEPSLTPTVSYSYLKRGEHEVAARVVSSSGETISEIRYAFKVVVPFYMTMAAYAVYILLVFGLFPVAFAYRRRMKQERIMRREREELETQIRIKSKELAASTLNLIQRNDLLGRIRKEVSAGNDTQAISIIDQSLNKDNEWETFERNFDNLHLHFFRNLRERYPSLTDNDLRFCAYLRLNLSSKDIASLMNISLKGVEAARNRIRKKLGLPSSASLTAFMIDLK